jgi:hypothetical protein
MIQPERFSREVQPDKAHNIFADRANLSMSDFRRSSGRSKQKRPGQPFAERVASNSLNPPADICIETQVQRPLPRTVQL